MQLGEQRASHTIDGKVVRMLAELCAVLLINTPAMACDQGAQHDLPGGQRDLKAPRPLRWVVAQIEGG